MSVPLVASWRVDLPITVLGRTHHNRIYLSVSPSADVTGYDVADRLGAGGIGLSSAIDAWLTVLAPLYNSAQASFGTVVLEQLVGLSWLPMAFYLSAVVPTSVVAARIGVGVYLSMRDTAFHRVKQYMLETYATPPSKATAHPAFDTAFDNWVRAFTDVQIAASSNPWLWARGRSDLYIGSWISLVAADNDKLRRERGLA